MSIERRGEKNMSDESSEGLKGNDPVTSSSVGELIRGIKHRGVSEEDFKKHPDLKDHLFGHNGKSISQSENEPEREPAEASPIVSQERTGNGIIPNVPRYKIGEGYMERKISSRLLKNEQKRNGNGK